MSVLTPNTNMEDRTRLQQALMTKDPIKDPMIVRNGHQIQPIAVKTGLRKTNLIPRRIDRTLPTEDRRTDQTSGQIGEINLIIKIKDQDRIENEETLGLIRIEIVHKTQIIQTNHLQQNKR